MGSRKALEDYLDRMFTEQYGTAKLYFLGQFCMGNEPSFHIPYLYNITGQPWKAQRKLRELMRLWFNDTPFCICGDEDGGAMLRMARASRHGFYPFCPGKPEYELGSPIFETVKLHLGNGKTFVINTPSNTEKTKYINSAALNGRPFDTATLTHEGLAAGGKLTLTMGERPNKDWAAK